MNIQDIGDNAIAKIIIYENIALFYRNIFIYPNSYKKIGSNKVELENISFFTSKCGLHFTCKRFYKLALINKEEIEKIYNKLFLVHRSYHYEFVKKLICLREKYHSKFKSGQMEISYQKNI